MKCWAHRPVSYSINILSSVWARPTYSIKSRFYGPAHSLDIAFCMVNVEILKLCYLCHSWALAGFVRTLSNFQKGSNEATKNETKDKALILLTDMVYLINAKHLFFQLLLDKSIFMQPKNFTNSWKKCCICYHITTVLFALHKDYHVPMIYCER